MLPSFQVNEKKFRWQKLSIECNNLTKEIGNLKIFFQKLQTSAFLRPLAPSSWKMSAIGPPSPLKMADVLYGWHLASNFALQNVHRKPTTIWRISLKFNTQYMRNLIMIYLFKMEYGMMKFLAKSFIYHKYMYCKIFFWISSMHKEDHFCNWICDFVEKVLFLWSKMNWKVMASAWRNFKHIFCRPLFTIVFRPPQNI